MTLNTITSFDKTDANTIIDFHQADEIWTVAPGVNVTVTMDFGARLDNDYDRLVNRGHILATSDEGVFASHAHDSVLNGLNASIIGYAIGVEVGGDQNVVTNHGLIDGLYATGVSVITPTGNVKVVNTGEITGALAGVAWGL